MACSTAQLVLFSEFKGTERTRFGEKSRTPLCSRVPSRVVQPGEDHRSSFRQVKCKVSLRHPNDISKEAVGMQRGGQGWRHVGDGRNMDLDEIATGESVQ